MGQRHVLRPVLSAGPRFEGASCRLYRYPLSRGVLYDVMIVAVACNVEYLLCPLWDSAVCVCMRGFLCALRQIADDDVCVCVMSD